MDDRSETRGVLYVATGKKYIQAAMSSARSVRKHSPDLAVHLFANWKECGFDFGLSPEPFTSVAEIDSPHYRSKVDYVARTPFQRTLYLDSDTRAVSDITPLFDLLDRFDIGLAHGPRRSWRVKNWRVPIPGCFPQFNSGVFLYRRTDQVWQMLQDWSVAFHEAGFYLDQITLRELVWVSDLRVVTLPPEYNLRQLKYMLIWVRKDPRAKILHLPLYHKDWFLLVSNGLEAFNRRKGWRPAKKRGSG